MLLLHLVLLTCNLLLFKAFDLLKMLLFALLVVALALLVLGPLAVLDVFLFQLLVDVIGPAQAVIISLVFILGIKKLE